MKLAIFDIDGTLARGSSERMFWRYLAKRRRQGPRQILGYMLFLIRYVAIGGVHTIKKNKAYLHGLEIEDVTALARDFVDTRLLADLYEPAVQRLKQHLNRGDAVVLMSGTLHPIAQRLADHLGVEHVCATLCDERGGKLTGQPPVIHPFDAAKLTHARTLAAGFGVDLDQVVAYGDSRHDLELLRAVGEPIAVRPDRGLLKVALEHDWEILPAGYASERDFRFSKADRARYM
jgi:HAD superfamily hydrolase (TIGR01490 family)